MKVSVVSIPRSLGLHEARTEAHESVRSCHCIDFPLITPLELLGQLVEIRERQFTRVGRVADTHVDHLFHDQIADVSCIRRPRGANLLQGVLP